MNEEQLEQDVRKFLKKVGVQSHQRIVAAVQEALAEGRLQGDEELSVSVALEVGGIGLAEIIRGRLRLD